MAKILLVDDDRLVREGLKGMLIGEGFDVVTAKNGDEARDIASKTKLDLVLLDVMMPEKNGFMVCRELRAINRDLPIIFLTAKDAEADEIRGLEFGAVDYLSKMTGEALLLARIRKAIMLNQEKLEQRSEVDGDMVIAIGSTIVNLKTLQMTSSRRKHMEPLTVCQGAVLKLLDSDRHRSFTAEEIIDFLRRQNYKADLSTVYTHISKIRAKLGRDGERNLISLRGNGYQLRD